MLESTAWIEFFRGMDNAKQLKHMESLFEIIKFHEMRITETQELISIIIRIQKERGARHDKKEK